MMVLVFLTVFLSSANLVQASGLSTHYIIGFDQSIPLYKDIYLSPKLLKTLDKVLEDNHYTKGEDYVSIVGYTLEHTPSMERFVRPYKDRKNSDILWRRGTESLVDMMKNWPNGQPVLRLDSGLPSSMQSLAKPYIVMGAKVDSDSTKVVDRTIILMVTDEVVNGTDDDYRQEWNRVKGISGHDFPNYNKIEADVFDKMLKFNEEFKFVQIPVSYWGHSVQNVRLSSDGRYKIVPYEVVPAEKPSIHAVTDMPSPLPLNRVRGGFRVNADVESLDSRYEINGIMVTGRDEELLGRTSDGSFDFVIPSSKISAGDTLCVGMSLVYKDGFYNGVRLSHLNDRYATGMTARQVVKIQNEDKVLGILPLYDIFWWWFPNSINKAVLLWDCVLVVLFILAIMWLIKRLSLYTPDNSRISLHPVKNNIKYDK